MASATYSEVAAHTVGTAEPHVHGSNGLAEVEATNGNGDSHKQKRKQKHGKDVTNSNGNGRTESYSSLTSEKMEISSASRTVSQTEISGGTSSSQLFVQA